METQTPRNPEFSIGDLVRHKGCYTYFMVVVKVAVIRPPVQPGMMTEEERKEWMNRRPEYTCTWIKSNGDSMSHRFMEEEIVLVTGD